MFTITPLPCPQCGAQMPDGVFTETCPSCWQAVIINNCPSCHAPGLMIIRQRRQRVAHCEQCDWTQIQQGLNDEDKTNSTSVNASVTVRGQPGNPVDAQVFRVTNGTVHVGGSIGAIHITNKKVCKNCKTTNDNDASYCFNCGNRF